MKLSNSPTERISLRPTGNTSARVRILLNCQEVLCLRTRTRHGIRDRLPYWRTKIAAYDAMRQQTGIAHSDFLGWSIFHHGDTVRILNDLRPSRMRYPVTSTYLTEWTRRSTQNSARSSTGTSPTSWLPPSNLPAGTSLENWSCRCREIPG